MNIPRMRAAAEQLVLTEAIVEEVTPGGSFHEGSTSDLAGHYSACAKMIDVFTHRADMFVNENKQLNLVAERATKNAPNSKSEVLGIRLGTPTTMLHQLRR